MPSSLSTAIPSVLTRRLILRGFRDSDLAPLHAIVSNRDVIRYMPRTDPWPLAVVEHWIAAQPLHWEAHGFGWFAVESRETGQLAGWCGLNTLPETGEVEVLYLLDKPFWGRGLATEAAQRCVQEGFINHRLDQIIGLAHPENIASQRVLTKCGLLFSNEARYFGMNLVRFLASRDQFLANTRTQ